MSVSLTPAAADRVKHYLVDQETGKGLRFGVKTSGCSGFSYVVDLAKEINDGDHVFESLGVKVIVDSDSLEYVKGTVIDFQQDGLSATFQFKNPNVADSCGCGESFSVN